MLLFLFNVVKTYFKLILSVHLLKYYVISVDATQLSIGLIHDDDVIC